MEIESGYRKNSFMKINYLAIIVISLVITSTLNAQSRLECKGPIPDHFTKLLSENINKDEAQLEQQGKKLKKEDVQNFLAVTNYGIQKYIQSGKLLYGDPLTKRANQVLDKLKAVSEEKVDHIKVYTIRSSEVNAFAIHQGFIVITTGLWARLENEHQLAFILGHEMNHITHQHSLDKLEKSLDQISFGQMTKDELSKQYKYAQDLELESDKEGFLLAQKAGYSDSLMAKAMKMLAISHRPVEEMKVDYSLFEDNFFKLSSIYRLNAPRVVKNFWDRNAENSVHPNAKNRYESLLPLYKSTSTKIELTSDFQESQNLARRDLIETYITDGNYVDGLYHCLILLKDSPKDQFLLEAYAMMWYGLSAEKNIEGGIRYSYDFRLTSGELQRFYYIFHNLDAQKLALMATREVWKTFFKIPSSSFMQELRAKVLVELVEHPENGLSNFYTSEQVAKLKRERRKVSDDFEASLVILLDKPEFITDLNRAQAANVARKNDYEIYAETSNIVASNFDNRNILMTRPLYSKLDLRKNVSDVLVSNQDKSNKLLELSKSADFSNTKIQYIGTTTADNFTTAKYNQMASIYNYLQENVKHRGHDFLPFSSRYIKDLDLLKDVTGIGLISFQSIAYRKRIYANAAIFSALSLVGFPSYLRWQLQPQQYTILVVGVYDLTTHNVSFRYVKTSDTPLNDYLENAQIYHVFNQINNSSK